MRQWFAATVLPMARRSPICLWWRWSGSCSTEPRRRRRPWPLSWETAHSSPEETAWAVRKLFEQRAEERPLIVIFEDLHWAERLLPRLDRARRRPFPRRADLAALFSPPGVLRTALRLGRREAERDLALPRAVDSRRSRHPDRRRGPQARRARSEGGGGQPALRRRRCSRWRSRLRTTESLPPTIQALLAARLDQLPPAELALLGQAAVEGHLFHPDALEAPADAAHELNALLASLVRKGAGATAEGNGRRR